MRKSFLSPIIYKALILALAAWILAPVQAYAQYHKPNRLAQSLAQVGDDAVLRTKLQAATAFDLSSLRGKVVLVVNWSTDCSVCMDYMTELRRNLMGWKGKPFVLIALNRNRHRDDYLQYSRIAETLLGDNPQCINVFHEDLAIDNVMRDTRLPVNIVVDTRGVVRQVHVGRIPVQAWDEIAELLP